MELHPRLVHTRISGNIPEINQRHLGVGMKETRRNNEYAHGRKQCCPEDPGHPRPKAGTRKRSEAGGMERSGRSEGQYACGNLAYGNIARDNTIDNKVRG